MSSASLRKAAVCIWACAFALLEPVEVRADDTVSPARTIASTSLCADAYVLALAGPEQIRALSWQVDQPVSAAPDWARDLPRAWPDAERILRLDPGVTVFGSGEAGRTGGMLDRAGLAWAELAWASDFDGVEANLRMLGERLAMPAAADAAVRQMESRLAELERRDEARSERPRIVYLSASGGSAGAGTFVDAAIRAAGGINATAEAGAYGWTQSDPEMALTQEADILLTSFFVDGFTSTFNRAIYHSAYRDLLQTWPHVDIPSGDWPCAGPRLIEAAERIANAIDVWEASR